MQNEFDNNPYAIMVVDKFKQAWKKRQECEENMSMVNPAEYNAIREDILKRSIELLKLGAPAINEGDFLTMVIDSEMYQLKKSELHNYMSADEYRIFCGEDFFYEPDMSTSSNDRQQFYGQQNQRQNPNDFNNAQSNPWGGMAPWMFPGGMGMNGGTSVDTVRVLNALNEISRRLDSLEDRRDDDKRLENNELKRKYEALKNEIDAKEEAFQTEKTSLEKKLENLLKEKEELEKKCASSTQKSDNLSQQKAQLEQKINESIAEINKVKEEMKKLSSEKEKLDEDYRSSKERENAAKKEIERLKNEINSYKQKCEAAGNTSKEAEKKINDLQSQIEQLQNENKNVSQRFGSAQNNINSLTEEKENLAKEKDSLFEKNNELEDKVNKLVEREEYYKELEKQVKENAKVIEDLKRLAYTDQKLGVMNAAAFNRDFSSIDKDNSVLVLVNVKGLTDVNISYGKSAGDNIMNMVVNELTLTYPNMVYRVMGAQFAVLVSDSSNMEINNHFNRIKSTLMSKGIKIVFGAANGKTCNDLQHMLNSAEKMLASNETPPQMSYQAPPMQQRPQPQQYAQAKYNQSSTPTSIGPRSSNSGENSQAGAPIRPQTNTTSSSDPASEDEMIASYLN